MEKDNNSYDLSVAKKIATISVDLSSSDNYVYSVSVKPINKNIELVENKESVQTITFFNDKKQFIIHVL